MSQLILDNRIASCRGCGCRNRVPDEPSCRIWGGHIAVGGAPMFDKLLQLEGSIEAAVSGLLGISAEHKRYLTSGYKCPRCGESISKKTDFYFRSGKKIPRWVNAKAMSIPKMIVTAGCPICEYRWEVYA